MAPLGTGWAIKGRWIDGRQAGRWTDLQDNGWVTRWIGGWMDGQWREGQNEGEQRQPGGHEGRGAGNQGDGQG